ncbi:MAG: HD-GYP domain-containing protein [Thermoleophilaceae bacterium]
MAAAIAIASAPSANWDIGLLVSLLVLSIAGDFLALAVHGRINISGSFLALVLAMVFLGGAPAALVGVVTIVVGRLHWKEPPQAFLNNLVTYASFPLAVGLGYHALARSAGLTTSDGWFYAAVLGVFAVSLILNFALIAAYNCALDGSSFRAKVTDVLVPVLPTEVVAAVLAIVVTYLYVHLGLKAIALFGLVIFYVQYLLGKLLLAEEHAAQLEHRTSQLASFQLGLITALLHTLDLRDRMTARHSAAVSRYSREIARAAGYPEQAQELVHTAALLHDIGKFAFPDHILKGETPLTEEDWDIIRAHPAEGARIVSKVEGYGPVGELILAHHERIDGLGYPGGLRGDRIPALARIMAVADTYDVMTARDSYRTPHSSEEAIAELRRVAGTQLDVRFVELLVQVLAGKNLSYKHGEDADFDAELALERRLHEFVTRPSATTLNSPR